MKCLSEIYYKIPMNDDNFFEIKKNDWNYSIDIICKGEMKFNLFNLFMILKSYYNSSGVFIIGLYFILSNFDNDNFFIYKKLNQRKFLYISYSDFNLWVEDFLESEKDYIKSYSFYGFRFVFDENSIPYSKGEVYPIYPWNSYILSHYKNTSTDSSFSFRKEKIYKKKYFSLLNTILKIERLRYRNLFKRRR